MATPTFEEYAEMCKSLPPENPILIKEVRFLPREDATGFLYFIFDHPIVSLVADFYCGTGKPSKWPTTHCDKDYLNNDFTTMGYQHGSTACMARVTAALYIGNGCRVEWLNQWDCFPDDGNWLNLRKDNITFATKMKIVGPDNISDYEEWTIDELQKMWLRTREDFIEA